MTLIKVRGLTLEFYEDGKLMFSKKLTSHEAHTIIEDLNRGLRYGHS